MVDGKNLEIGIVRPFAACELERGPDEAAHLVALPQELRDESASDVSGSSCYSDSQLFHSDSNLAVPRSFQRIGP